MTDETTDATTDAPTADYPDLTIVIDPDAVVNACAADGRFPERNGHMVVDVRAPFEGPRRAKARFHETGNHWPPAMDPKPLELRPEQFHDAEWGYPASWEINEAAAEVAGVEDGHDAPDEVWDECRDVQVEAWESEVRATLVDEVDVTAFNDGPREMVPVRYDIDGEDAE